MDQSATIDVLVVGACVIVIALVSTAQAGIASIGRLRVKQLVEEGASRARLLRRLLEQPGILASTLDLLNLLALITAAVFALRLGQRLAPWGPELAAILGLAVVVLIFGEIVPKAIAIQRPERAILWLARPVILIAIVLTPLIQVVTLVTAALVRLFHGTSLPRNPFVTEEELRAIVAESEEHGVIEEEEREMINSIFEFGDTCVREVMVPRIDVEAIEAGHSLTEAVDIVLEAGYSRVPVYRETIDNVIGVLYAKDLLQRVRDRGMAVPLEQVVRPAYFVPESKKVDELLHELQQSKVHMAIVVDEYGGTAGLVTIEDLLEEIVGEIQDEYDTETPLIERVSEQEFVFDARVSLHDVNEALGVDWEADDVDTLGGLVYDQLGKIPDVGDTLAIDGATVEVISTEGRRLKKLKVLLTRAAPDLDEAATPDQSLSQNR